MKLALFSLLAAVGFAAMVAVSGWWRDLKWRIVEWPFRVAARMWRRRRERRETAELERMQSEVVGSDEHHKRQ